MTSYERWLDVALEAVAEAAPVMRRAWRSDHAITAKGYRDIVTDTDVAVETILLRHIREAFPDHAVTSEEAGADAETARVRWLVDPVDGTTNFAHNNPNFSTSIAALDDGVPVVGVVFEPLRDHVFSASLGNGARLNGEPIHTSGITDVRAAIFSIDTPREPELRRRMWTFVSRFLEQGRTLRALGSAALNMAYCAAGWVDGYFSVHMKPWDQAAGGLLVQEAGGAVATLSGRPWSPYEPDPLMAASPHLLATVGQLLGER